MAVVTQEINFMNGFLLAIRRTRDVRKYMKNLSILPPAPVFPADREFLLRKTGPCPA